MFKVLLNRLHIGNLFSDGEYWTFVYTKEFQDQNEVVPIMDFPNKNKEYKSKFLSPFFVLRLGDNEQDVDHKKLIQFLKAGKESISNPFILQFVENEV